MLPLFISNPSVSSVCFTVSLHDALPISCCHLRILCPTFSPDSKTMKGTFCMVKCAAAASPTGPAPIMATGKSKLNCFCSGFSTVTSGDEQQVDSFIVSGAQQEVVVGSSP